MDNLNLTLAFVQGQKSWKVIGFSKIILEYAILNHVISLAANHSRADKHSHLIAHLPIMFYHSHSRATFLYPWW